MLVLVFVATENALYCLVACGEPLAYLVALIVMPHARNGQRRAAGVIPDTRQWGAPGELGKEARNRSAPQGSQGPAGSGYEVAV